MLITALIVVLAVTHDLDDPDQWQHLTVGRYIWEQHRLPMTQLWTWPTYGVQEINYAWGFEALVWPFWKLGGVTGLYVWRWIMTLAAFGFAWAAARRMGARGFSALVLVAVCAMIYRSRTQVRPEGFAAVLLMAELFLLEARRHGARIHPGWLVLIAWIWANTHISYYMFFILLGIHILPSLWPFRRADTSGARDLWVAALAGAAISFVNPWGWRTLWQPFEYWLVWRHELIYSTIVEMKPIDWDLNRTNGLAPLLVLWPALAIHRLLRRQLDVIELAMCAVFTALVMVAQRFIGLYALVACVYVSRDLDALFQSVTLPRWARSVWSRAGLALALALSVATLELRFGPAPIQMGVPVGSAPIAASDFIQRHDLHGRLFNHFDQGGYLTFRFWPRRDQLPFIGIHQEGTKELRRLYVLALETPAGWRELNARYPLDYLVLRRQTVLGEPIAALGFVERDTTWVRVFSDDAANVYVRRHGPFAKLAADSGYRFVPADPNALASFGERTTRDSTLRRAAERELLREIAGSPAHARALNLLANIALFEGRWDDARRILEEFLKLNAGTPGTREKLGVVALQQNRPREARRWFEAEQRLDRKRAGLNVWLGQVAQADGDLQRARREYLVELKRDPGNAEARDSLASVERQLRR